MQFHRKSGRRGSEINITPLVDVMLVLLVIFMAVSPSMHSDVEVKVPKVKYSHETKSLRKEDLVKLVISAQKLFINEKEIAHEALISELSGYDKKLTILVKADRSLSYEKVYEILDLLKAAGYVNIALVGLCE